MLDPSPWILLPAAVLWPFGSPSLLRLAREGSPEAIHKALQGGAQGDLRDKKSGATLLMLAIAENPDPVAAARLFLDAGADVRATNHEGRTALHHAIVRDPKEKALELTRLLLSRGAEAGAPAGQEAYTALHIASARKYPELVKLLLAHRAPVNAKDCRGEMPLHRAASIPNNGETLRLLLAQGADPKAFSINGTPLHRAAFFNVGDAVAPLVQAGADLNGRGSGSEDKTPLETALDHKSFEAARALILAGAQVNTQARYAGFRPFRYRNNTQTYAQKLVHGDASASPFEVMTPLHRAITQGHLEIVKLLVEKGARLDAQAHFGGTPLDFAQECGDQAIADYLRAQTK